MSPALFSCKIESDLDSIKKETMADLDCSSVVIDIEEAYDSMQRGKTYLSLGAPAINDRNSKIESSSRIEIESI